MSLPGGTWIRLIAWLLIGQVIYFSYSRHHSRVQASHKTSNPVTKTSRPG